MTSKLQLKPADVLCYNMSPLGILLVCLSLALIEPQGHAQVDTATYPPRVSPCTQKSLHCAVMFVKTTVSNTEEGLLNGLIR